MNAPKTDSAQLSSRAKSSKAGRSAAPAVSVVMPVHNALPYLDEAIESILGQTFSDFEFVILDDASTDGSTERLAEWAARDPRIRLLRSEQNLGPALSSQKVASEATAPIVARMDADDIAYPERLGEQLRVLHHHPEAGLVASLYEVIDPRGRKIRDGEPWRLASRSISVPFAHGTIMFRRSLFDRVGGYREECEFWEDHDFASRMSQISKIVVIPRPLYKFRQSPVSTRVSSDRERVERAVDLMYRCLDRIADGEDYEAILHKPEHREKLDPRVYVALGFLVLWAGGRPRLFQRLLTRGQLSMNFASVSALVWTGWATLSPSTLRAFMQLLRRLRNALVPQNLQFMDAVPWSPRMATKRKTLTGRLS